MAKTTAAGTTMPTSAAASAAERTGPGPGTGASVSKATETRRKTSSTGDDHEERRARRPQRADGDERQKTPPPAAPERCARLHQAHGRQEQDGGVGEPWCQGAREREPRPSAPVGTDRDVDEEERHRR